MSSSPAMEDDANSGTGSSESDIPSLLPFAEATTNVSNGVTMTLDRYRTNKPRGPRVARPNSVGSDSGGSSSISSSTDALSITGTMEFDINRCLPAALTMKRAENTCSEVTLECEALPAVSSSEEAKMRPVTINMEPVDGGHHLEQQLDNVIMEERNRRTNSTYSVDSGLEADKDGNGTPGRSRANTDGQVRGHPLRPNTFAGHPSNRNTVMLSEYCVVTVNLPAYIATGQKGKGAVLKFRFSPYTKIEYLRIAILKHFHEKFNAAVKELSKLHLCRYVEEEEGWEWLMEESTLNSYNLPKECKFDLKPLEPNYHDVRVVIPQLESTMNVEYDQFSTVKDVLQQVLTQTQQPPTQPPLHIDVSAYTLFHVRLRVNLDLQESLVHYEVWRSDTLECKPSSRRKLDPIIVTVIIPAVQSSRKVQVCLEETVGDLVSMLMRRVPDPGSSNWSHMSLYLTPRVQGERGTWLEDFKFLSAYKLKSTDVLEFRAKYRPMTFELKVFSHDHTPDTSYTNPELLVAQETLVGDVVDLLCSSCSLEYAPHFYGLYLHNNEMLPHTSSMWEYLDQQFPSGYQDTLVLHMMYKPVKVSYELDQTSSQTTMVDFSEPCLTLRDLLCRRYGVRNPSLCGLRYEGFPLKLDLSLHNQGVLESQTVELIYRSQRQTTPSVYEPSLDHLIIAPSPDPSGHSVSCSPEDSDSDSIDAGRPVSYMLTDAGKNIWEEGADCEDNLQFDHRKFPYQVSAATFNKLVEKLTAPKDHDMIFVKTFLLSYQSFTTPDKLLHKLIERYNVVRTEGMDLQQFDANRTTIQVRVINAIRLWLEMAIDFKDNSVLQSELLNFITTVLTVDHPKHARQLRTSLLIIKGVIQKKNAKTFTEPPPPVKIPPNSASVLTLFDFDPEEIARQLTIIDFSLFVKIKPMELMNQVWLKPKQKHKAANLLRLVDRMNNLTYWVATTIISQKDIPNRAKRITTFVHIASHLHHMRNYCTLMSVLNGLNHPAIKRLKKTFPKLDRNVLKRLDELQDMVRPGNNFKLLREDLKKASHMSPASCIPYLGLFMSDLTFLDNGNPNFLANGLINFNKCRLIHSRISDLILCQDKPYNFEQVPPLHDALTKFHFLDNDTLYDVSLQREPRDKDADR